MRDLNEFINEAKKGRAWSGKINQIDGLMSWLYDKDILGKGEKNKKDSIFRQYYRYYNDGDFPRALSSKGIGKYNHPDQIENALEELLDDFIKKILTKYLPKINRTEFRYDQALSELKSLKGAIDDDNWHGVTNYWGKRTKVDSPEFNKLLSTLEKEYVSYKKSVDDHMKTLDLSKYGEYSFEQPSSNHSIKSNREKMKGKGDWPKNLEKGYQNLEDITREMGYKVNDVIVFTQRAKELLE